MLQFLFKLRQVNFYSERESTALGRRLPWANRVFSKSIQGKMLNFLHEVEKMISVILKKIYLIHKR